MKRTIVERNIAGLLFVIVLVTFSLAQRDTKKMEKAYSGTEIIQKNTFAAEKPSQKAQDLQENTH